MRYCGRAFKRVAMAASVRSYEPLCGSLIAMNSSSLLIQARALPETYLMDRVEFLASCSR